MPFLDKSGLTYLVKKIKGELELYAQITDTTEQERIADVSPKEGYYFTTDQNKLWYYDGLDWHLLSLTINDITPTYNDLEELADMESGESLPTAFAKLKLGLKKLIAHLSDYGNPHHTSKSSIGLGKVENKSSEDILGEMTFENVVGALGYTPPRSSSVGVATSSTPGTVKSGGDIYVDGTGSVTVVGGTATKLKKPVNITLSGKVSGSAEFDGSGDAALETTVSITSEDVGLENVTNDKQIKGLEEATPDDVVIFGEDGYTVKDSGFTIQKSVPENALFTDTIYEHPTYTEAEIGLYKVAVDEMGHVSSTTAMTKEDIEGLGIEPGLKEEDADRIVFHDNVGETIDDFEKVNAEMIAGLADVAKTGILHITDDTTGTQYKLGVADGKLYIEEVEAVG